MKTVTLCCLLIIVSLPVCLAAQVLPATQLVDPSRLIGIISAPSQLTAIADGTSVNLAWQDNSTNETVFDIERKDNEGSFRSVATVRSGNISYANRGLNANTQYTYRVRAMTSSAFSTYSNEAVVTTGSALLNNPGIQVTTDIKLPVDLNYIYKINAGSAAITKYKGLGGDVLIPSTLGGAKVTRIDTLAFEYCADVTSIVVPASVTSIGMDTFRGCKKLKSITLPNGITSIGLDAFAECSGLTSINLPTSLKSLEMGTFNGCSSLTEIVIPASVTTIKEDVFYNCIDLNQVTIPQNMVEVAASAFYGCSKLTSINVAVGNPAFTSIDGILYSKDKSTLVAYPTGKVDSSVTIPAHVKTIGAYAFTGLSHLKSVTLPNGVTSIGNAAFMGTGLTSITIPGTLNVITPETFQGCSSLTTVSMVNGIQTIGGNAFSGCTSLKGISMPSSIKNIKKGAFQGCPTLRSIWFYGYPPNIDWDAVDYKTDNAYDVTHHYTEVTLYYPRSLENAWLYDWNSYGWDTAPFDTLQANLQGLSPNIALQDVALPGLQTSTSKPASTNYPGPLPDGSTAIQLYLGKSGFGVNGQSFNMDTSPISLENWLHLPVRYVAEPLGAAAVWNQQEKKVTVTLHNTVIEMWIDQNMARINGVNTMIDPSNPKIKPVIIPPGRTMLPLRFLAETLGCEVVWDQNLQQATLTKRK